MTRLTGLLIAVVLLNHQLVAQNNFRTRQDGDWNQSSTWEEFIAGSWQLTANTPTFSVGTITIQSGHIITVTAPVTIDQTVINSGGTLVVNDGIVLTLNNGTSNDFVNSGTVRLLGESYIDAGGGTANIIINGTLEVGSLNPTGAILTGTTAGNIRTGGVRTYNSGATVTYNGVAAQFIGSGHPNVSGVNTIINNINGVTFNSSCVGNPVGSALTIPGSLTLTSGNLNLASTTSGRILIFSGDITANGNNITLNGASSGLTINGTGALGTFPFPTGSITMGSLNINRPSGSVDFSNQLTITGNLSVSGNVTFNGASTAITSVNSTTTINSGSIDFNGTASILGSLVLGSGTTLSFEGQSLTLGGNITSSGGVFSSNSSSNLTIKGSVGHSSALSFSVSGNVLNSLSMTMSNAGTSATIGSALTVITALNLNDGILSIGSGNLALSSGATITKSGLSSLTGASPSGGPWNLTYTGMSQATGIEIPTVGDLNSLTVSTDNGSLVTLGQDVNIANNLTISSAGRTFTSGINNVSAGSFSNAGIFNAPTSGATTGLTVAGSFVNNGTFNSNGGTVVINGPSAMSGSQITTTSFNNIEITSLGALTAPTILNIQGNLTNDGIFSPGTGKVVFSGSPSTLSGTQMDITNFYDVTINSGTTVVPSNSLIIQHNFVINGTFSSGVGTVVFNGIAALSGTNINTTLFNGITINASSSLTSPTTFLVAGNFANSGTFTAGSGTIIFSGNSTLSGSTITSTNFNNVTIDPGAIVVSALSFNIQGNFVNNGTFTANNGTVVFTGNTGAKTLSGTSNTQFFNLTLNKGNSGTSLTVNSSQTVTNSLTLTAGILAIPSSNLALGSNTTLTRVNSASIETAPPAGGPWNVVYSGSSKTTGLEIPVSGIVESMSVDINNGATVNLNQAITVINSFTLVNAGRTFTSGANSITVGSFTNAGTFNAPSSTAPTGFTISGNFVNNGTFVNSSGVLNINGSVTMSGTAINTTNFNDIFIDGTGTLTAPSTLNVQGHFTNNGNFTAGSGAVVLSGNLGSKIISGTTNTLFNTLVLNKGNAGISVTINSPQTITNFLTLTAGQLSVASSSLSLSNGATISRNSNASLVTTSPSGGPWNLIYTGSGLSTGLEISSGSLLSLTVNSNSSAAITLTSELAITNDLTINAQAVGPVFTCGTHSVSVGTLNNSGIFSAPTPALSLTLTGDLVNNGTFNKGTGAVVFNGTSNISGSSTVTFHHITVAGILNRPADLFLTGNFVNNGIFSGSSGTIHFNGTSTQDISGTTITDFNDLNVVFAGSPRTVRLESNQNLIGTLTVGASSQFDADGSSNTSVFALMSTDDKPALDASIAELPSGASVVGSVTVQRYMSTADNFDRFISSPVTNAPVSQLQDDFAVTGNFTGTSYPCAGCSNNGSSLKYYNEPDLGAFSIGYKSVPNSGGSNTQQLLPGVGYDAYMWNATSDFIWDVSGPINSGPINFTVTHTASTPAVPTADGWNLLGNPYPSAIQWNNGSGWTKSNIDPVVWVWDVVGRVWRSYNANASTGDLTNGIIATGQGFWVYVPTVGVASLAVNEAAKSTSGNGSFYRQNTPTLNIAKVSLHHNNYSDNAFLVESELASEDFNTGIDAIKFERGIERMRLAIVEKDIKLGYYGMYQANEIPLSVFGEDEGIYRLEFSNLDNNYELLQYSLFDSKLAKSIPLSEGMNYEFVYASKDQDRFSLIREYGEIDERGLDVTVIEAYPNPTTGKFYLHLRDAKLNSLTVLSGTGVKQTSFRIHEASENNTFEIDISALSEGIYLLQVLTDKGSFVKKVLKKTSFIE
jgi:hypothetical protein